MTEPHDDKGWLATAHSNWLEWLGMQHEIYYGRCEPVRNGPVRPNSFQSALFGLTNGCRSSFMLKSSAAAWQKDSEMPLISLRDGARRRWLRRRCRRSNRRNLDLLTCSEDVEDLHSYSRPSAGR